MQKHIDEHSCTSEHDLVIRHPSRSNKDVLLVNVNSRGAITLTIGIERNNVLEYNFITIPRRSAKALVKIINSK
jgi:hypothetical protein